MLVFEKTQNPSSYPSRKISFVQEKFKYQQDEQDLDVSVKYTLLGKKCPEIKTCIIICCSICPD